MTNERRPILFIDDGGVMNNNGPRGAQWQRLVGEFLPQHLGGQPEQWAEANREVIEPLFALLERDPLAPYAAKYRAYRLAWVRSMCEYVGVPVPPDDEALAIERAASDYVTARVRAAFPGAAEAIRELREAGFVLHTASGEDSHELHHYLTGMGVRDCFGTLYGPDIIDLWKGSTDYYRRIFAHAGIDPADALVIDDSAARCAWAMEVGAQAVQITPDTSGPGTASSLRAMADRLLGAR